MTASPLPAGPGVGYKPQHYAEIIADAAPVRWLEIHAENYMGDGGRPLAQLRHLAERFPISVHGVVGMWGLLAVCLTNDDATLMAQLMGLVTILGFVFIASGIVWFAINAAMGVRVSEEEEHEGVDIGECGVEAYPEFAPSSGAGR